MVNTYIVEYNYEHIINLVPTHNLICYRGEHLGYFLIYFDSRTDFICIKSV